MKLLTLHSDFIEFEPLKKAVKSAEEAEMGKRRIEECLVAFMAVEKGDEDTAAITARGIAEIIKVAEQVKVKRVVVYPFVHLTSIPSSLDVALVVLKGTEAGLREKGYEVTRAPFGWYKSFDVRCKGHPLSELSRQIRLEGAAQPAQSAAAEPATGIAAPAGAKAAQVPGEAKKEAVSDSLKVEATVKSRYYVLTPGGELIDIDKFDFKGHDVLRKFVDYEIHKVRAYDKEPPHIALMREHAIASHEPGSDTGNLRWYPNGRLMKKIIERKISDWCISFGAMEVETPIMYDYEHPTLKKYLNRFPARQYVVKSDEKEFFLRFAACFGQFLMNHDMVISYKNLPLRMFELSKYSFRREQSGEVAGLRRLRAFTMPDMHTLCRDLEGAREEFERQFDMSRRWMDDLVVPYEAAFRMQTDWYAQNKEFYANLAKKMAKPVLIEMFDKRYAYFVTKFEFNFVDSLDKASALSTVQIDVENAETYDITYTDEKGQKQLPYILHTSISGSTDRNIYALLENEAMRRDAGKVPMFPVWLAPTQVRIVPISDKQLAHCEEVLAKLKALSVRADLDDRGETLQKKVREGEKDWVPFIAVVGDKEIAEDKLSVRVRSKGTNEKMGIGELAEIVKKESAGAPFEQLTMSEKLSKRPIF